MAKDPKEKVNVVVGARPAICGPFENLGIIIIDEEHETSHKQRITRGMMRVMLQSSEPIITGVRSYLGVLHLLESLLHVRKRGI